MTRRKEKLLIGPRIRRLRRTLGITQAQMAEDLGVSASYINLIEANQRPISAKLLLTLAQVYDFNLSEVGGSGDARLVSELMDVARDDFLARARLAGDQHRDRIGVLQHLDIIEDVPQ